MVYLLYFKEIGLLLPNCNANTTAKKSRLIDKYCPRGQSNIEKPRNSYYNRKSFLHKQEGISYSYASDGSLFLLIQQKIPEV